MSQEEKLPFNRIAIIELYDHIEVLRDTCTVMLPLAKLVYIYTKIEIKEQLESILESDQISWVTYENSTKESEFLLTSRESIEECQLVLLLTINRPYRLYTRLLYMHKTTLVIHNVHAFLNPWSSWTRGSSGSLKTLLRAIRFFVMGDYLLLKSALKKAAFLGFPSESMHNYVHRRNLVPQNKGTVIIPLGLYEHYLMSRQRNQVIQICIPGKVRAFGRDYEMVFRVFQKLLTQITDRISLVLLGSCAGRYGRQVKALFEKLSERHLNFDVQGFLHPIRQSEFDTKLGESDFLIIPLTPSKTYDAFSEKLGYSSISGSINDMSRFGIPAILPAFYPLENWRKALGERFEREDQLLEVLKDWIKNRSYLARRESYLSYRVEQEKVLERFTTDLQQMLN